MIFPELIWLCWIYAHSWTPACSRKQVYRAKPVFFLFFFTVFSFFHSIQPRKSGSMLVWSWARTPIDPRRRDAYLSFRILGMCFPSNLSTESIFHHLSFRSRHRHKEDLKDKTDGIKLKTKLQRCNDWLYYDKINFNMKLYIFF